MATEVPPPLGSAPPRRKARWFLYGCGGFIALLLVIVATVAITVWWIQRPIKPVVLSTGEKAEVEAKLQSLHGSGAGRPAMRTTHAPSTRSSDNSQEDRPYVPGAKVLKLTEREINGLLNENTDLGKSVRLEFGTDAINAYLIVPIPKGFPIAGGKMFRARGRFRVSLGNEGDPYAILEDVTVFGLSLPKAWLGGIKGENLLANAVGPNRGRIKGVQSLRVEPGALVLEVED